MKCPTCGRDTKHEGGNAGLVRDYCPGCGWEQWTIADPAFPSQDPVPEYEYALYWASPAGATVAELAALRRIIPGLDMTPLPALRSQTLGHNCWDLGEARGLDMERVREAATREGLRLECRLKKLV